jgi:hypothetical protein
MVFSANAGHNRGRSWSFKEVSTIVVVTEVSKTSSGFSGSRSGFWSIRIVFTDPNSITIWELGKEGVKINSIGN